LPCLEAVFPFAFGFDFFADAVCDCECDCECEDVKRGVFDRLTDAFGLPGFICDAVFVFVLLVLVDGFFFLDALTTLRLFTAAADDEAAVVLFLLFLDAGNEVRLLPDDDVVAVVRFLGEAVAREALRKCLIQSFISVSDDA